MAIVSGTSPIGGGDSQGAALFGAAAGGGGGIGLVYMGDYPSYQAPRGASAQSRKNIAELSRIEASHRKSNQRWMTTTDALTVYRDWSAKQRSDFVAKGILTGLLKPGDGVMEGAALWKKLVTEAGEFGKAGHAISPNDILKSYVDAAGGAGKSAWRQMGGPFEINVQTGEKRYMGPGTYLGGGKALQTDTRVDLTDPDTARSIATKLFQDMMGRDPGQGELAAFADALHSAEQSSPVVTAQTTQYDMDTGQPLSTSTSTSGGLTAEARSLIGENQVKGKKEYGVTQAATTYQSAFDQVIFGGPQ